MLLRELFEQTSKVAVLAFGRMNPPTIGHAKLVDKIKSVPGDHFLFLSHSQDPKKDPLDFNTKLKFAKAFFPGIEIGREGVNTPVVALQYIQSLGYTDVVFVAGSDRVDGFQKLFDTYNGNPDKSGKIPFQFDSITVISAGERDPDADGAEGMSASKMRAAAAAGDFESFSQGTPNPKLAQQMYDAVRKNMGIAENSDKHLPTRDEVAFPIIRIKRNGEKVVPIINGNNGELLVLHDNGKYMKLSPRNKEYLKKELGISEKVHEDQGNITPDLLKKLEYYLDKMFASLGIDVEFTRHFLDRVNDERNVKPITIQELAKLFKNTYAKWGKKIAQLGPNAQAVIKDMSTDINVPFVLNWDNAKKELDLVAKTVMRKKNFATPNQQFQVESVDLKKNELMSAFEKFLPIAVKVLDLDQIPKIKLEKYLTHQDYPSFGRFVNDDHTVHLGIKDRHPIDILRTFAHELVHFKQSLNGELDQDSGKTGSSEENEAHIKAGVIMRVFNKKYPEYFKSADVDINENFADGKVKGKSRPGRVKRAGASCKGSVSALRQRAKRYGGERGKMYHWCANMKSGKK